MPTAALHSNYWQIQVEPPPDPIGASGAGGYVPWQTTIISHHGFGVASVVWAFVVIPMVFHGTTGLGT
jgi:hypothetical protein